MGNIPAFEIGKCGKPPTVPDFNVTAFLGDWYAQRQTASSFQVIYSKWGLSTNDKIPCTVQ